LVFSNNLINQTFKTQKQNAISILFIEKINKEKTKVFPDLSGYVTKVDCNMPKRLKIGLFRRPGSKFTKLLKANL